MAAYNIDVATLKEWMAKKQAVLVDVREPSEWNAGYIESATLIPLGTVGSAPIPAHKDRKLVVYCRSGKRSLTACDILLKLEPALEVYNLEGGILAWNAAA